MTLRSIFYACLASLLAAMAIDAGKCAWVFYHDTGTEPARMTVRNRIFLQDGIWVVGVRSGDDLHWPGTSAQIYNWDGTWWTKKAYSKTCDEAHKSRLGLRWNGMMTMDNKPVEKEAKP